MHHTGKYLTILYVALGLALPAGYASGALAQTTGACNGDDALVGAVTTIFGPGNLPNQPATPMMTIAAVLKCAPLQDGQLGGVYASGGIAGSPPPAPVSGTDDKKCGAGRLVVTLQSKATPVFDLRLGCGDVAEPDQIRFSQGPRDGDFESRCPSGQYAHGLKAIPMQGSFGFAEIRLTCLPFKVEAPDPEPQPVNDDDGDDDDNGHGDGDFGFGNGGIRFQIDLGAGTVKFGSHGKVRTVREETTIYRRKGEREIEFLEPGDKVTVLACEKKGRGWCAVVKPVPGYVWGGDLK